MAIRFITFDDKGLRRYRRDLNAFAKTAVPFATRAAINTTAFQGAREAKKIVGQRMILRNRWTQRSIGVQKARQKETKKQRAFVGSTEAYMLDQEFGTTKRGGGKHGVEIPTRSASGEGRGSAPRRRLPRAKNKARSIRLRRSRRGASRKQRNFIAVREAATSGRKFVFLDLQRAEGIYKIMGGKRNPKPELIVDLSHKTVRIPPTPWLKPAMDRVRPRMAGIWKKELRNQLIRRRLFVERR